MTPLQRPDGMPAAVPAAEAAELAAELEERLSAAVHSGIGTYDNVYYAHGSSLAIIDGEARTSIITFPENGRVPDLTPEGQMRVDEARAQRAQFGQYDNPENRPLSDRCLTSFGSNAGPPMLPNGFYNNNYAIVQTPDHVMIMTEMVHDARIIRLGEPDPLPDDVRPWFGDSWGRWEGDTLVVETTNFHPLQRFQGHPSDNLKVIERFHLTDANTIAYGFTIEDPTIYSEPWGGELPMVRYDDLIYEYACHEGNYAMEGILRGARTEEAEAAGGGEPGR